MIKLSRLMCRLGLWQKSLRHDLTGSLLDGTRRCTVCVSVSADCYICIRASMFFSDRFKTNVGEIK